jgi:hypothetical protein
VIEAARESLRSGGTRIECLTAAGSAL